MGIETPIAGYIALEISSDIQARLRSLFPPKYDSIKGDHVTLALGMSEVSPETQAVIQNFHEAQVEVYGTADDDFAVQALLVSVNGEICDPKGRPYHITVSVNSQATVPAEYNDDNAPSPAKARHAAYVSGKQECLTLWEDHQKIRMCLSAKFFPSVNHG